MIIRDTVINNIELVESKNVKLLFKIFFTIYLVKADVEQIFLLYKHVTSEGYSISYRDISINYIYHDTSLLRALMIACECFKLLDLLIHANQLNVILINFEILREAANS